MNQSTETHPDITSSAYISHDHTCCIDNALGQAAEICQKRGQRLTPLRKQVLELVWDSHKPVGAYDVLAMMSRDQERPTAPPTVYRALDFLLEQGLIHRIASLNAYIGCHCPGHPHEGIFLICKQCRTTQELPDSSAVVHLRKQAGSTGFQTHHALVELTGLCPACQEQ